MSRARRLLVVAAAWAIPAVWILGALLAGPSDGTVVSSSVLDRPGEWRSGLVIVAELRDGPLEPGDVVQAIDGRPVDDWAAGRAVADRTAGETITYAVLRPAPGLEQERSVEVRLGRYPLAAAVARGAAALVAALSLLAVASLLFWRRPRGAAQRSLLAASSLLTAALTSSPLGLGVVDLAGGRGIWPMLGGELLASVGLGCCLAAAVSLTGLPERLRARPWLMLPLVLLPLVGYAAWLPFARNLTSAVARLESTATVLVPSLVVAVPAIALGLGLTQHRAAERSERLAARLALLTLLGATAAWLLLETVPQALTGDPLLPTSLLVLLLVPAALAGIAVAVDGYRIEAVEPAVRRAVVRGFATSLVAVLFVGLAAAVGQLSDIALRSLLAGGVIALAVLPLAVLLQRAARRLLYGDRELPRRVVSELRRLDVRASPEDALGETLTLLARRLRLSYAAIEVDSRETASPLSVSVGERRGDPFTVDLVIGGADLGRLSLETAPDRDAFGPADRRLLEDVGVQVGALVQAVIANRDLQASRERLVTAREEERRRLRRDLHDGLGPSLALLALRLEEASQLVSRDPDRAIELVEALSEQARDEIGEVRRLVEGLRPPALDQLGLVSALRQRATEQGDTRMTWTIEADDLGPLPAAVEVAAYRIVLEAVTNALHHSGARTCTVSLHRDGGMLLVRVQDTGHGLVVQRDRGVGLTSMRERAEELGGAFSVASDDHGTLVEARLPIVTGGEE